MDREWRRVGRELGLSRSTYGTGRYVRRDRLSPRHVLEVVEAPQGFGVQGALVIEGLDTDVSAPYRSMGLEFARAADLISLRASARIGAALAIIATVADLATTLAHLLGAVHILEPPDLDHDVSHSDPEVPFSVFIGLSSEAGTLDRLRVAEQLIHECMHLQLTLLEGAVPLVRGAGELHASPWKGCERPTQGVLHGFYVFSVLDAFFERLAAYGTLHCRELACVEARRREISGELDIAAAGLAASGELTSDGRSLVARLATLRRG